MPQGKFAQATAMLLAPNCRRSLLLAGERSCSSRGSASALKSSTPADTVPILGNHCPAGSTELWRQIAITQSREHTLGEDNCTRIWALGWRWSPHLGAVQYQILNKN